MFSQNEKQQLLVANRTHLLPPMINKPLRMVVHGLKMKHHTDFIDCNGGVKIIVDMLCSVVKKRLPIWKCQHFSEATESSSVFKAEKVELKTSKKSRVHSERNRTNTVDPKYCNQ